MLLEGVPGLAKTLTVRTLAETIDTTFHRIQFTPDLLPADVLGTQVYDQSTGQFSVKRGPIFANIILADEINRAPAKVQAALPGVTFESSYGPAAFGGKDEYGSPQQMLLPILISQVKDGKIIERKRIESAEFEQRTKNAGKP